jgi:hypothetical protein
MGCRCCVNYSPIASSACRLCMCSCFFSVQPDARLSLELSSTSNPVLAAVSERPAVQPPPRRRLRLLVYIFEWRNFHPLEKSKPLCTCLIPLPPRTPDLHALGGFRVGSSDRSADHRHSRAPGLLSSFLAQCGLRIRRGQNWEISSPGPFYVEVRWRKGFTPLTCSSSFHRSCRTEP